MKLLIVDDESITREGIIEKLPWSNLGIDQIKQADDGINGLEMVKSFTPDIILTDVRMPRMDGIQMAFEVKKQYPNCIIVFMSGYSDKEYLLSAIELKAVSYVEKPIRIHELKGAIENAIAHYEKTIDWKKTESIADTYKKIGIPLLKSELALLILNRGFSLKQVEDLSKDAFITLPNEGLFHTIVVKYDLASDSSGISFSELKTSVLNILDKTCSECGINYISCLKDHTYIIIHLYGASCDKHLFTEDKLSRVYNSVVRSMERAYKYFICPGGTTQGITNAYQSYDKAMSNMKMVFFDGYNKICSTDEANSLEFDFNSRPIEHFVELVEQNKWNQVIFYVKSLTSELKLYKSTPVNTIKCFYISILHELYGYSKYNRIDVFQDFENETSIREILSGFETLSEIAEFIIEKIKLFLKNTEPIGVDSNITRIYKYIQEHYNDDNLSINRISEYTHFAPTYVCSLFKEKTGKTLNQFITEYRIEKSKELLQDTTLNVTDIGFLVGLGKAGYFTKLFKKATGVTPSEYRERL